MPVTTSHAPRRADILRRFRSATGGNVAIIFALSCVPLLALSGAAIDYGLALRQQTRLQASSDATVLNLCQTPPATTTAQLQLQANTLMAGYVPDPTLTVDSLKVVAATQGTARTITLSAHVNSITFFGGITGVKKPLVFGVSQCATPVAKTFEIAMVLDNTGSMAESSGSQSKIQAVQQAASNFVDYVKTNGAFSQSSKISIVPFAAAVAVDPASSSTASWVDTAGKSQYHWANIDKAAAQNTYHFTSRLSIFNALQAVNSNWAWAGCFETPPYPQNVQDGAPSTANTQVGWNSLYVPMFAPDEPGAAGINTGYGASWSPNNNSQNGTYYSVNSYLDDGTNSSACSSSQSTFSAAEMQACKYYYASALHPNSNSAIGIPNGPNMQCVSKPLQRLTSNSTVLKSLINSMTAAGSTNIFDGIMWGWRTLSPISVFADGAPYTAANSTSPTATTKVIILMTDGTNTWSPNWGYNPNLSLYFPFGFLKNADGSTPASRLPSANQNVSSTTQQRAALDELTLEACTNAKAAGVSIYTVGFSIPSDPIDSQGLQLLQACATNSSQAFVANTSDDLITAFNKIAASIGALRISQ